MENEQILSPYRVLDLTEGGCMVGGKILGDLGADVIKIEPPGGSPSRSIGPFYRNDPDPEKSLYWFAYNTNKRSVVLDLAVSADRDRFCRLVETADIILENYAPGFLDSLSLGYASLCKIKPDIILTSITPFGQTGPKALYKGCDLTAWASGGCLYVAGDPDRAPVGISFPQAYLHGGAEAAAGSMIALRYQVMTGQGQHVDISIQQCVIWCLMNLTGHWECHQYNWPRDGMNIKTHKGTMKGPGGQRCKDGYVSIVAGPLPVAPIAATFEAVKAMMIAEGKAPDWWLAEDWYGKYFEMQESGDQELMDRQWAPIENFLSTKTKAELYDVALKNRLLLSPAQTVKEIHEDPQLKARDYWVSVEHPELDSNITYCGPPVKMSKAPWRIHRRPPLIGEHTLEILGETEKSKGEQRLNRDYPESSRQQKTAQELQACEGIKILDFSWAATGPMSVRYLADYGAEVIHVQSFSRPCFLSYQRPRKNDIAHPDYGYWAAMYNGSKYSITLNFEKQETIRLIYQLIEEWQPDIVAESFTPGVMERFGLDYEKIRQIKPDVIYFSTCIQGQYGPRSHYPGYGNLGANLAGFYYISGYPDRDISPPYGAYTDFINMRYGATHLIAALEYRRRTGRGMHLDMSQYEVGLQFMAPPLMDYMVNGRIFERNGNRLPHASPHGVYPCKGEDRWVAIGVFNDDQWKYFCEALNDADWRTDPKFSTLIDRKKNEDELDALIAKWSINYTPEQVATMMQDAGVAAHVVLSVKELFEDPQLIHRHHFRLFEHKVMGATRFEGLGIKLSKTPDRMWCPAAYGEHNSYVFKEILNLTDGQISDLMVAGAISTEADYFDMVERMLSQQSSD